MFDLCGLPCLTLIPTLPFHWLLDITVNTASLLFGGFVSQSPELQDKPQTRHSYIFASPHVKVWRREGGSCRALKSWGSAYMEIKQPVWLAWVSLPSGHTWKHPDFPALLLNSPLKLVFLAAKCHLDKGWNHLVICDVSCECSGLPASLLPLIKNKNYNQILWLVRELFFIFSNWI